MTSKLLIGLVVAGTACGSPDVTSLRYTGTIEVTKRIFAENGAISGSIFGRITIPSELEPTRSIGDCDYFSARLPGGVTLGALTVTGTSSVVVDPTGFVDGTLYLDSIDPDLVADGTTVTATLAEASGPVTINAVAPPTLVSVTLPTTVSLADSTTVTWQAGSGEEITVALEVEGLGTFRSLLCRTADTGSFEIPADALAAIEGNDTQATLSVTRGNVGSTASETADAQIDLAVQSSVFGAVALTRP